MDVGAVLPVSLEGIRALSLNEPIFEGRILEAKVTAMLSNTLARLAIDGQTLDVATPKPLPVGAMLTLRVERAAGQLMLITQGPIRNPETPAAAAQEQAFPSTLLGSVKAVLAKVQGLAFQAMLAEGATAEPAGKQGAAIAPLTPGAANAADGAEPAQSKQGAAIAQLTQMTTNAGDRAAPAQGRQGAGIAQLTQMAVNAADSTAAAQGKPGVETALPAPSAATAAGSTEPALSRPGTAVGQQPQIVADSAAATQAKPPPTPLPAGAPATTTPAGGGAAETSLPQTPAATPAPAEGRSAPPLPAGIPQQGGRDGGIVPQTLAGTPRQATVFTPVLAQTAFTPAVLPDGATPAAAPMTAAPEPAKPSAYSPPSLPNAANQQTGMADETFNPRDALAQGRETRAAAGPWDAFAAGAATDMSAGQARTERAVSFAFQIPLHFPGNPTPLHLEVTREDEPEQDEEDAAPRSPTWTIRFAAEAGNLGTVHAAITYADARIGVRLWAEQPETAALLNQNAPDLQNALQASDLRLEALTIAEGRPAERPSGDPAAPHERRL